jgi:hypothetical protein
VDRNALADVTRLFCAVLTIVAVTGALWGPLLVRWVLGDQFAAAAMLIAPLFVAAAVGSWRREGLGVSLYLGQRPYWLPVTGVLQLGLIALLLPLAAVQAGVVGAAVAMLLIEMIMLVILWQISQRVFFIPHPVLPACLSALACAAAAGASISLDWLAPGLLSDLSSRLAINLLLLGLLVAGGAVTVHELAHMRGRLQALGGRVLRRGRA